jgi:hypothetical protein
MFSEPARLIPHHLSAVPCDLRKSQEAAAEIGHAEGIVLDTAAEDLGLGSTSR